MDELPNKPVAETGTVSPSAIAEGLSARGFALSKQLDLLADFLRDADTPLKLKVDVLLKIWKMQGLDDDPKSNLERKIKNLTEVVKQAESHQNGTRYPQ